MVGPTASGKSEIAIRVAQRLDAIIVSVDSMQVYRGMDIGTAKPTLEERSGVPHHLIDVADPEDEFSVAEFRSMAREVVDSTEAPVVVVAGGSGLHFRALVDPLSFAPTDSRTRATLEASTLDELESELLGVDPDAGQLVDLDNRRRVVRAVEILRLTGETPSSRADTDEARAIRDYRPELPFVAVGVDPGETLGNRISARVDAMLDAGLVSEALGLKDRMGRTSRAAVGYREILDAEADAGSSASTRDAIVLNTKRLAGRQRTWFQRDPRIRWIPWSDNADVRTSRVLEMME